MSENTGWPCDLGGSGASKDDAEDEANDLIPLFACRLSLPLSIHGCKQDTPDRAETNKDE